MDLVLVWKEEDPCELAGRREDEEVFFFDFALLYKPQSIILSDNPGYQ